MIQFEAPLILIYTSAMEIMAFCNHTKNSSTNAKLSWINYIKYAVFLVKFSLSEKQDKVENIFFLNFYLKNT